MRQGRLLFPRGDRVCSKGVCSFPEGLGLICSKGVCSSPEGLDCAARALALSLKSWVVGKGACCVCVCGGGGGGGGYLQERLP